MTIGTSIGNPFGNDLRGNVAFASNANMSLGNDNNTNTLSKGNTENLKAEFAYEMARFTAEIVSAPIINAEKFKIEFAYAAAKVTAKVMPIVPNIQRNEFAYQMAQITTKIISNQNLDIQKMKVEFAYEVAQITTKIIMNADESLKVTDSKATALRNNADIEAKVVKLNNADTVDITSKTIVTTGDISPETYTGLVGELMHVGDRSKHLDNSVNMDGEIRYHYALNSGLGQQNSSGIRARLGFDTGINQDWRVYSMLEGQKGLVNYNNEFKLSHLYVAGKLGESMVTAGSFGYLMAEGNIYDSGFKGAKVDFGQSLKYTLSYGETDYTKKTYIATARYTDFDYNVEAGVHHYQTNDGERNQNTIRTLGANYNFSNFGVGAMILDSNLKDSKGDSSGYVLSLNYGDLKTWRRGTYGIFAKYYDQPQYTYIAHGMNGTDSLMQGFKGYGLGINYTLKENFIAGIEYYNLTDKILGSKSDTWWSQLTHYF